MRGKAMARLIASSDEMIQGTVGSFGFSGIRPDRLGATEYTLATIVLDITGSMAGHEKQMQDCVLSALDSLKKSPRADNLLVRYVTFNTNVYEDHGFLPLQQLDPKTYKMPHCDGLTALYDAMYSSIGAAN